MAEPSDPSGDVSQGWEEPLFGLPCPFPSDDPRYGDWLRLAASIAEADERLKARFLKPYEEGADLYARAADFFAARLDLVASVVLAIVHDYRGAAMLKNVLQDVTERVLADVSALNVPGSFSKSMLLSEIRLRLHQRAAHWFADGQPWTVIRRVGRFSHYDASQGYRRAERR